MTPEAEVLSAGASRPPLRIPRGVAAVVALVALVLATAGWRMLRADPERKPQAAAAPAPSVSVPSPAAAAGDHLVFGERTGARLAMGGDSLFDIGLDDGYVRWTQLPGATLAAIHVRSGDVLLVSARDRTPSAVFVPADRRRTVALGAARALIAAADDDHIWLASTSTAAGQLTKVDLAGRVVRRVNLGDRRRAVRETRDGMLTVSTGTNSGSLDLWDIATHTVARVLSVGSFALGAADGEHAAFTPKSCARPACPVKVVVIRTGDVFDVPLPDGWASAAMSLSPDGRKLAVLGGRVSEGAADEPQLLVADLATRALQQVDGVEPGLPRPSLLAWSPDSQWFFVASDAPGVNVLGYRVGDRRVRYAADPLLRQMQPAGVRSLSAY